MRTSHNGRRSPDDVTPLPAALAALVALLDAAGVALALEVGPAPETHRTAAWHAAEVDPRVGALLVAARAGAAGRRALSADPLAQGAPDGPEELGRAGERRVLAHAAALDDGRRLVAVVVAPGAPGAPGASVGDRPSGDAPGDGAPSDDVLGARYGLSAREAQVARLVAAGRSTPQIAAALGISAHTVKRHRERTFAKLGVHSRRAVRARLHEAGRGAPAVSR